MSAPPSARKCACGCTMVTSAPDSSDHRFECNKNLGTDFASWESAEEHPPVLSVRPNSQPCPPRPHRFPLYRTSAHSTPIQYEMTQTVW
eukprot:1928640-Rhodomonas_salina.8